MPFDYPCNDGELSTTLTFPENQLLVLSSGSDNIINSATSSSIGTSTTAQLSTLANTRVTAMKPPRPNINQETSNFIRTYIDNINNLNNKIKTEYCYYYKRYYVAVRYFLDYLINYSSNVSTATGSDYDTKLNRVITLNKRLIFLTYFTNSLAQAYNTDGVNYNNDINTLNGQMTENQRLLNEQRQQFQSSNMNLEANRRMVEFTQEKNRANNNLLAMYAVLNVAAFAMLVYVART